MAALARQLADLERAIAADEPQKVVELCNAVLANHSEMLEVSHAKAIAQLRLGQYAAAADALSKLVAKGVDAAFHHAYALYRAGKTDQAVSVLSSGKATDRGSRLLLAQLYYKLEDFKKAALLFDELLANTPRDDPEYQELLTNCNAARSLAGMAAHGTEAELRQTHEMAYNAAHVALRDGRLGEAEALLEHAIEQCKSAMTRDGATPEELADELAPILTQLAFVKQISGRGAEALSMYETVIKARAGDLAAVAVASNNIVSIKQEHEMFDSVKRLRSALAEATRPKLLSWQLRVLRFNTALLSLHMSKFAQARTQADELLGADPASAALAALLHASLTLREKSAEEALSELAPKASSSPLLRLAHAQLLLQLKRFDEAAVALRDAALALPAKASALGSAACMLYSSLGKMSEALGFVDQIKARAETPEMVRFSAQFRLQLGDPRAAIADLEKIVAADADDLEALAALIKAYAIVEPSKAEKYASQLPQSATSADIDTLENVAARRAYKLKKKEDDASSSPASPTSPGGPSAAVAEPPKKLKAKRKRKIRLPKNYDPANPGKPDPERWVPKRMRSTYRPKKKRNRDGPAKGGSQGATPSAPPAGSYERNEPIETKASPAQTPQHAPKPKKKGKSKW